MFSTAQREALLSHGGIAVVNLGPGREHDVLTGSHFGNFYSYRSQAKSGGVQLDAQELLRDSAGRVIRNPIISATPIAFPARSTWRSDLIVGGEGALLYFRFVGIDDGGRPIYDRPRDVLEEQALVYTGTLPVVYAADWDGDGATDLIVGNSEGKILVFRNHGSSSSPDFARGEPVMAGGDVIHTQQGYWGIQGPGEARWGYISPTVADWNGDGAPNILSSDATARHTVYLTSGVEDCGAARCGSSAVL